MAFTIASTFAGPVTSSVAPTSVHSRSAAPQGKNWGVSGPTCASISATVVAIVGRAVHGRRRKAERVVTRSYDPTMEVGAMEPLGYWDPLHLMREGFKNPRGEYKSKETFDWYRAAELKHGRISMMATIGYVFGTYFKWPGFQDIPSGMGALDTSAGGAGLGAIILGAGIFELVYKQDPSKEPGNLGDPAGFLYSGAGAYTTEMRNAELAHCRLAMSGIITTFTYEYFQFPVESQWADLPGPWKGALGFGLIIFILIKSGAQFYIADDSTTPGMPILEGGTGDVKRLKA